MVNLHSPSEWARVRERGSKGSIAPECQSDFRLPPPRQRDTARPYFTAIVRRPTLTTFT